MKTVSSMVMTRLDNPDVKEKGGRTSAQRKAYRMRIIRSFLKWANKGGKPEEGYEMEEINAIKRIKSFKWWMFGFGTFTNFLFY